MDLKRLQPSLTMFSPYSAGINCRRQILTSTVDPRTVRSNIFLMVVERANYNIYDDFKYEKNFGCDVFLQIN